MDSIALCRLVKSSDFSSSVKSHYLPGVDLSHGVRVAVRQVLVHGLGYHGVGVEGGDVRGGDVGVRDEDGDGGGGDDPRGQDKKQKELHDCSNDLIMNGANCS
jgi:hypothetical protein